MSSTANRVITRKLWMLPRNIRRVEPLKLSRILSCLLACARSTTDQATQDLLYEQLAQLGVKRPKDHAAGVANPGGFRTYLAQLSCLGLVFLDSKKVWQATNAGYEIINGDRPVGVLRCQLLRMQYPSVYGNGQNVRIDSSLKVRPFCFLIDLLQDPELQGYLTEEELGVPVIYARTQNDYKRVKTKILELRNTNAGLRSVVESLDDLLTPRCTLGTDTEKNWQSRLQDVKEIANTFKNYLLAARLICQNFGGNYELATDSQAKNDIDLWKDSTIKPAPEAGYVAQWLLNYGRFDKAKAVRITSDQQLNCTDVAVRECYMNELCENPYNFDHDAFVEQFSRKWGQRRTEVARTLEPFRKRQRSREREVVEAAANSGGTDFLLLEKAVASIFWKLGFEKTVHMGQRQSPRTRSGGYPDVWVQTALLPSSGWVDTKATHLYGFPITDTQKLVTYYKNCWQEIDNKAPSTFFLYLAGGFANQVQTIENNLKKYAQDFGHPVSAMTASALLDLVEMPDPPGPQSIVRALEKGTLYVTAQSLVKATHSA